MLDEIRADLEDFIEDRSGRCPESVCGCFLLCKAKPAESGIQGIVLHTAQRGSMAGEEISAIPGEGLQFFQDGNGLT